MSCSIVEEIMIRFLIELIRRIRPFSDKGLVFIPIEKD